MHLSKLALMSAFLLSGCATPDAKADTLRLSSPRAAHMSINLDDGRVALIGGCVRDGCGVGPASATVEIFDPQSNDIVNAGRLLAPRIVGDAAKLPDGRILLAGGWEEAGDSSSAEIFDPVTGRSQAVGSLVDLRGGIGMIALRDGRVLVAGGTDGRRRLAGAEIFDPKTSTFTAVGPLGQARSGAEMVLLADGRVLVIGGMAGQQGDTQALASVEIFDPATNAFAPTGALIEARFKHAAVRLSDGRVLVIGGSDDPERGAGKKRTVEIFDPDLGRFASAGSLIHPRYKLSDSVALLPDGRVLVGGSGRHPEVFDPATRSSEELPIDLGGSWNFMTAARLPNGNVLLTGGYSEEGLEVSDRAWLLEL